MARRLGRFLRQNTIGLLALFVALGGTTYAATALPKNSVGTKQLKKNAVTSVKVKAGAVTGAKITNGAVSNAKIGANAVTGAKVKDDSLTGADVLESSFGKVPSAAAADSATTATNATNAANATTAANANALGGVAASGYLQKTAKSGDILSGQLSQRYVANSSFTIAGASYPVPLPSGVATPTLVYTTSTTPDCPGIGTVATAGTLCVYGYNVSNVQAVSMSGGPGGGAQGENKRFGFSVDIDPTTAASAGYFLASWAYKVP